MLRGGDDQDDMEELGCLRHQNRAFVVVVVMTDCALYDADEDNNHNAVTNIKRKRSSADRCDDDQADDGSTHDVALLPKLMQRQVKQARPTITETDRQIELNTQVQFFVSKLKCLTNISVMVYTQVQTHEGDEFLMGARAHSRFDVKDGDQRKRAVEALDDNVTGHPSFDLLWPDLFGKMAEQERAMELQSQIHKLVSQQECNDATDDVRAPTFWIDAAHAMNKPRSTSDNLYLCKEALAQDGKVVNLRTCIDNHTGGGACHNTNNVLRDMKCNSALRVFVKTKELVIMAKKKLKRTFG